MERHAHGGLLVPTIPLPRGLSAVIDECDLERVSGMCWYALETETGFYAARGVCAASSPTGRYLSILMHRLIMGLGFGDKRLVDHKDGNTLDNRRENLRVCTKAQNTWNRQSVKKGRSGFIGVHPSPNGKWRAVLLGENKRRIYLGTFVDPVEAARQYDAAASALRGEFVCLNFPAPQGAAP